MCLHPQQARHVFTKKLFSKTASPSNMGSPISFMPINDFYRIRFRRDQLRHTRATIKSVSGHDHSVLGQISASLLDDHAPQTVNVNMIITKSGPRVLGLDSLRALYVKVVLTASNL